MPSVIAVSLFKKSSPLGIQKRSTSGGDQFNSSPSTKKKEAHEINADLIKLEEGQILVTESEKLSSKLKEIAEKEGMESMPLAAIINQN